MILWIFILLFLSLLIYVSLKYYVLPKKLYEYYSKNLQKWGYKVYKFPFKVFGAPFFQKYYEYFLSRGDSLFLQKNQLHKYDVILSNVLDTVCLTLEKLQLVKQFYSPDNVNSLTKHPSLSEGIKMSLGHGIMFSQKDIWKRKRKIISQAFNYELLNKNIKAICQITDQTLNEIQIENYFNSGEQNIFQYEPKDIGFRIFSRVMLRCFFECEFQNNKVNDIPTHQFLQSLFDQVNKLSGNLLVLLMGKYAYKLGFTKSHRNLKRKVYILQQEVLKLIKKKVQEYKNIKQTQNNIQFQNQRNTQKKIEDKSCNLIYKLLESHQKGQQSYDQKQLLQEFCTFLIVGTDTTSNFLRTTLFYLSKNPQIQQKIRKEINQHIKHDQDLQNIQKVKKLTYLQSVQHEVIRIAGPSATCFIRLVEKDLVLGQMKVLKNTGIFIQSTGNHYNHQYFKEPQKFNPERWINEASLVPPYAFTGFFGGPRTCIGKHLAYLESKIALIKILRRYQKFQISAGGERMQVRFLYGPQRFLMKFQKQKQFVFENQQVNSQFCIDLF